MLLAKQLCSTRSNLYVYMYMCVCICLGISSDCVCVSFALRQDETISTIPTVGFNVENVQLRNNLSLTVWDIGGQKTVSPCTTLSLTYIHLYLCANAVLVFLVQLWYQIRALWRHYYRGSNAIVWMVDSSDIERIELAKEELSQLMIEPELSGIPLLVFANKQDLPRALSGQEMDNRMELPKMCRSRHWFVQECIATKGEGIYEGFNWLAEKLLSTSQTLSRS